MKAFIFTYIAETSRGAKQEQVLLLLEPTKQQTTLTRKAPLAGSNSRKDTNRNRTEEQKLLKVMWILLLMKGLQPDLKISFWVVSCKLKYFILLSILLPSFTTPMGSPCYFKVF